jgi:hypothetical protein
MKLLTWGDLQQGGDPVPLIAGVIQRDSLVVLYGQPGAGKTFLALDFALCISAGTDWKGRATHAGPVVYLTAEGQKSIRYRVAAWLCATGIAEPGSFHVALTGLNLLDREDVNKLIAAIRAAHSHPMLVVFDTLARHMPAGDENSSKDMGSLVAACDHIRREFGCAVLLVHHMGKDKKLERGSSALRGAADTMISVRKDAKHLVMRCEKQKDEGEFEPIDLVFRTVELGEQTSLVLEYSSVQATTSSLQRLASNERKALEVLCSDGPLHYREIWRRAGIPEGSFGRTRNGLLEKGLIAQTEGDTYQISDAGAIAIGSRSCRYRDSSPNSLSALSLPFRGDSPDSDGIAAMDQESIKQDNQDTTNEPPSPSI